MKEGHKIFEKWRDKSEKYIEEHADEKLGFDGYSRAWRSDLNCEGISQGELIKSLMKDFTTFGLVSNPMTSSASAGDTNL